MSDAGKRPLVFDVGANTGAKTARMLAAGARVVCFEPVPECLDALHSQFDGNTSVAIVPCALGAAPGSLTLSICSGATTISTFSDAWKKGRFSDQTWDRSLDVRVITLDAAIAEHGRPAFAKIDVEGFELQVLRGLTQPIPVLSFEFCREGLAETVACIDHLNQLGYGSWNVAYGEYSVLRHATWMDSASLLAELHEHPCAVVWGDVYACHAAVPPNELLGLLPRAPASEDTPEADFDTLNQLLWRGLTYAGVPIRLHLGCGEQLLAGYINIDYPADLHNVMVVRPDLAASITDLRFPPNTVDEIRLHHVFEHFNRVVALGLLIRWHGWLKPGGRLIIETPDFEAEARAFLQGFPKKRRSFAERMSAIRSLEGDQTAAWAYHVGHWFEARYRETLTRLGFENIAVTHSLSGHTPTLHNITASATRGADRSLESQLEAANELLWNSTVAEAERPTWKVWCNQLRQFVAGLPPPDQPIAHAPLDQLLPEPTTQTNRPALIAVRLQGGLGNQLFQYAAARAASLRLNADLVLDISAFEADPERSFYLGAFRIAGTVTVLDQAVESSLRVYKEPYYHYDEAFDGVAPGTLLDGYFQSERYFTDYADQIRADLELAAPPSPAFDEYAASIRAAELPVSLHIRRGDFVARPDTAEFHGICDADYYERALRIVRGLLGASVHCFVFSDDHAAARDLVGASANVTFVESDPACPWEDMMLMSLCRHHILANSSFSWWGVWLNRSVNKVVIAPRAWVASRALRKLNTADLYPPRTITI